MSAMLNINLLFQQLIVKYVFKLSDSNNKCIKRLIVKVTKKIFHSMKIKS